MRIIISFGEKPIELCFIFKGTIVVYDKNSQTELLKYDEGSYFGDSQILQDIKSNFTYASTNKGDVQLYCIKTKRLLKILEIH